MSRRFIGLVAAAAVAITAIGQAPARADENVARALAVILGAAIAGKVLIDQQEREEQRREEKRREVTRRQEARVVERWVPPGRSEEVIRRVAPRPLPPDVRRRLLPGDCLRSFETRDGRARIFDRDCLKENYAHNRDLPRACEVKFRTHKKVRRGYDAYCLRREGYQLARR